jgi:hypothetical protein
VHLAGPAIRAAQVIRQRCAWCGALIDEFDLDRIAIPEGDPPLVEEDGTPRDRWVGLVAVDVQEGVVTAKWAVPDPVLGEIPDDSCMALDPAVTS